MTFYSTLRDKFVIGLANAGGMPKDALAVAVSGGVDSAVLWRLAADYKAQYGFPKSLVAIGVDHRLRAESGDELLRLGDDIKNKDGVDLIVLRPESAIKDMRGNVQQNARRVRYALMAQACKTRGVAMLAVAHHADDVAENALLAMMRGAGVRGVSSMRPRVMSEEGVVVTRPLLNVYKSEIIAAATEAGVRWSDDPTNATDAYMRNRVRTFLQSLPDSDETAKRIVASVNALAQGVDDEDERVRAFALRHSVAPNAFSSRIMDRPADALAVIAMHINELKTHDKAVRRDKINRMFVDLQRAVRQGKKWRGELAGVTVKYVPQDRTVSFLHSVTNN